ncbi:hypothetical protein PIB30_039038 [Stylosanthes scabra]|uniref:Uncharacterized protein n=1 Tax=Stylosanthes scabra TaxID=79078 RepID=A0ABU6REB7_9FABA|nr:hypothetical protein [Stylosanthes scabra]
MVQGTDISFAPRDIKRVLKLKSNPFPNAPSYSERKANKDYRLEEVQEFLCLEGREWAKPSIVKGEELCSPIMRSHSDPGSLLFDLEIERTLRRTRQARRRAELARLPLNNNPFYSSNSSFDSNTQPSSSISGTSTMAERLILKQLGGGSTAFDNQPNRFPELNANFELKSGLIDLLSKFCG